MNTLENILQYKVAIDDEDLDEAAKKEKAIMFNYQDPTLYLLNQLSNIPSTSLPSVLRFIHVKYLYELITHISSSAAINQYPSLTSSILNYVLLN